MNQTGLNNDIQAEQNIQLADLEPQDEVKGGAGARISKIVIDSQSTVNTYTGTTTIQQGVLN